jgi:hypothetical protein
MKSKKMLKIVIVMILIISCSIVYVQAEEVPYRSENLENQAYVVCEYPYNNMPQGWEKTSVVINDISQNVYSFHNEDLFGYSPYTKKLGMNMQYRDAIDKGDVTFESWVSYYGANFADNDIGKFAINLLDYNYDYDLYESSETSLFYDIKQFVTYYNVHNSCYIGGNVPKGTRSLLYYIESKNSSAISLKYSPHFYGQRFYLYDKVAPKVECITAPEGRYYPGDTIYINVKFDEFVNPEFGKATLILEGGGVATLLRHDDTSGLIYQYIVREGYSGLLSIKGFNDAIYISDSIGRNHPDIYINKSVSNVFLNPFIGPTIANDVNMYSYASTIKLNNNVLSMNKADFLEQFSDKNLDSMEYITIKTLPEAGHLEYQNAPVEIDDQIPTDLISDLDFVSDDNWAGHTSFTYFATDSCIIHYPSNTGVVNINIKDGPMIGDGSIDLNEDEVLNLNMTIFNNNYNNYINIPIKQIKITSLPDENLGKFVWNYFGEQTDVGINSIITPSDINNLFFLPTRNATGVTSFDWMMTDNEDMEGNTATMSVTVSPVNDAPVITETDKVCLSNGETSFNLDEFKSVYSDVEESDLVKIKITRLPNDGTLVLNGSDVIVGQVIEPIEINNLIFSANRLYDKIIDFGWKASDGELYSTEAAIHIVFNDPPACLNFTTQVNEDEVYSFTLNDFEDLFIDPDHDRLQAILFSEVSDGTISLHTSAGGIITLDEIVLNQEIPITNISNLVYVPVTNDNGLVTFKWHGSDGHYISNESTGTFDILPVNDMPILSDIHKISAKDADIIITTTEIMNHFYDADNDVLVDIKIKSLPNYGELLYNNQPVIIDQVISINGVFNFKYIQTNPSVTNDSITYQASDGSEYSNTSSITITVEGKDESFVYMDEDSIYQFEQSDFNINKTLDSIKITSIPENGILSSSTTGSAVTLVLGDEIDYSLLNNLRFTPNADFNGITTFKWQEFNGISYLTPTTLVIQVEPINDSPTILPIIKETTTNSPIMVNTTDFLSHYNDIENDLLTAIKITKLPDNCTLKHSGSNISLGQELPIDNNFVIEFIPENNNFTQVDLSYKAFDGSHWSEESVIIITFKEKESENSVNLALDELTIGYSEGDSANSVKHNVSLRQTGAYDTSIEWSSSAEATISQYGVVKQPGKDASNETVTLTATISKDGISKTKVFELIVKKEESSSSRRIVYVVKPIPTTTEDSDKEDDTNIKNNTNVNDHLEANEFYDDIDKYTWAIKAINAMTTTKVVDGHEERLFDPSLSITRGEFAAYLVNLMDVYDENATEPFDDVIEDTAYAKHIASAYVAGLIKGYSSNEYGPEDFLTRQDITVIMCRAMQSRIDVELGNFELLPFIDKNTISNYAKDSICMAFVNELLEGYDIIDDKDEKKGREIRPFNNMNRAEATMVIYRLSNKLFVVE